MLPVDPREVRWEHRWLGFLRFDLTGADADDTMVGASPYVDMALEKVQQFGGHVVELWPTGLDAAFGLDATEGAAQRAGFGGAGRAGRRGSGGTRIRRAPPTGASRSTRCRAWWARSAWCRGSTATPGGGPPRSWTRSRSRRSKALVLASGDMAPFLRRRFIMGRCRRLRPRPPPASGPGTLDPSRRFRRPPRSIRGTPPGNRDAASTSSAGPSGPRPDRRHRRRPREWEVSPGLGVRPRRSGSRPARAGDRLGGAGPPDAVLGGDRFAARCTSTWRPGEAEEVARDKVTRRLGRARRDADVASVPVFLALLDVKVEDAAWQAMDPTQRRRQTLAGIKRLMLRESTRQPLLLVFEDAHWTDAETRELLDELAEGIPVAHVLMLVHPPAGASARLGRVELLHPPPGRSAARRERGSPARRAPGWRRLAGLASDRC